MLGSLLLAFALDAVLGDPSWLWRRLPHPVVAMGGAIAWIEARSLDAAAPPAEQARRGQIASLLVIGASTLVALGVQALCLVAPLGWLLLAVAMSTLIAARGLYDHVSRVAAGLEQGLAEGREAIAHIVGRDPASLDAHGVARAAIESTAENFADGVVAPLFWGVLLGLPGMAAYKAINTLDSMIGHRSPRYLHFGRFAARLDDFANWLPARLSALLILGASLFLPGTKPVEGWRALWRDASHHRSPPPRLTSVGRSASTSWRAEPWQSCSSWRCRSLQEGSRLELASASRPSRSTWASRWSASASRVASIRCSNASPDGSRSFRRARNAWRKRSAANRPCT